METLWLELYIADTTEPTAFVKFAPPTLASEHLDAARAELCQAWTRATAHAAANDRPSGIEREQGFIEERLASVRDPRLTNLTEIGAGEGSVIHRDA